MINFNMNLTSSRKLINDPGYRSLWRYVNATDHDCQVLSTYLARVVSLVTHFATKVMPINNICKNSRIISLVGQAPFMT